MRSLSRPAGHLSPAMSNTDDGKLLRRYAESGDREAFDALCERYWNLAYRTAYRELGEHEAAQDCAAAVFATLARRAKSMSAETSLACWIFATSVFTAKNARKVEARRLMNLKRYAQALSRRTARRDPNLSHALNECIGKLSREQREAILLRFVQGCSFEEIAAQLGQTPDGVRMRVNRALANLRESLGTAGYALTAAGLTEILNPKIPLARPTVAGPRVKALLAANAAAIRWAVLKFAAASAAGLALMGAGYHKVQEMRSHVQAAALVASLKAQAAKRETLHAKYTSVDTSGGSSGRTVGMLDLARPDRFRIQNGPLYASLYISNGKKIWSERHWPGSPATSKEQDATPENLRLAEMNEFLAYVYMTGNLEDAAKVLVDKPGPAEIVPPDNDGDAKFRIIEFKGPTDYVRFFVDRDDLVEGMETKRRMLSITELPDGNRKEEWVWTTSTTFLSDIRRGQRIPDSTFAYDPGKTMKAAERPPLVVVGAKAPDFTATDPSTNRQVRLSEMLKTKKGVLLDFWFLGCPPCRAEMPEIAKLYASAKDAGLAVLCVNGMDASDQIRVYFRGEKLPMTPLIARHDKRADVDEVAWAYGINAYPTNVLISPSGEVLWVGVGFNLPALRDALGKAGF
ncbi:MAG TPA: sigma-70 family RNA polymerase sigma factor [Fimbriimonadaceae bacterium]|nr:sigma-70 family RNA polymerase sigma factor [Fimbriimonadaceae bacterium]